MTQVLVLSDIWSTDTFCAQLWVGIKHLHEWTSLLETSSAMQKERGLKAMIVFGPHFAGRASQPAA